MKKETLFKKAETLYDSILPIQTKIRKKCEDYIRRVLEENGGSIDFDDYEVDEYVSVPYDGGRHPEYASNCFSIVNGIYLGSNGGITINTEDCDEYPLESVDWYHVYCIAEYLNNQILKKS